ncbi:peptidase M24, structural domain-containing protein [Kalaharituber pfeilii]|nr:peptidase M24, structural domain-containing protein [Kalaharituber pfeilii]
MSVSSRLNCAACMRRQLNCIRSVQASRPACPAASLPRRQPPMSVQRLRRGCASSAAPEPLPAHASELRFGQPIYETHPHLVGPGDLTRNISAHEYHARRASLSRRLPPSSVAVFTSSTIKYRSGPVFYSFHQDPDFLYLTGFLEPDALGVLETLDGSGEYHFTLFVQDKNPLAELWDGPRSGVVAARDVFNADDAYPYSEIPNILPKIIARNSTPLAVIYATDSARSFLPGKISPSLVHKLSSWTQELRLVKSPGEIANMRIAGKISGRAFNRAMSRRWKWEKDLWAYLEYWFMRGGCEKDAYIPVVAGGKNALTIHYTRNEDPLRDGDLVLVDAGGQYSHYPTDITRTFPVSGVFTPPQAALYQAVLNAQRHCIKLCVPGATLEDLHQAAKSSLLAELRELGPSFPVSDHLLDTILFPHHVSHYLGLDLHDCPSQRHTRALEPGVCLTVEPGVYVPADDPRWPPHFRGLGIRIEDSVCVVDGAEELLSEDGSGEVSGWQSQTPGPLVLSVEAVKEIVDIEALGKRHLERMERERERRAKYGKGKGEPWEEEDDEDDF